jgi:peptide/nickel transport system permease protein
LGLDKPVYTQFFDYMKNIILHFNFGYSFYSGASVLSLIKDRLPATLSLTVGAAVIWLLLGIPVGIASAIKRGSLLDRASMSVALVFVSMPVFWLGLIVLFLFAQDIGQFHIFPGANSYVPLTQDPVKWFTSLLLPWFVLAATSAAIYSRVLRGSLIETMGEDYIRTARAKGLRERRVIWRHGVRSAITPVLTIFGLDVGALLGGAVITETVFDIPGIGRLNYDAIVHSDFPIVQGTVILAALFIVVANIVVDIAYAYLDPRVRYS